VATIAYRSEHFLSWGAGAQWNLESALTIPLRAAVTLEGATSASSPFRSFNRTPMELLYQATYELNKTWQLFAGGAFGLVAGVGTPDFRIFSGIRMTIRRPDQDGDGIPDILDACKEVPEDRDGIQDQDGCPEEDADQDGIPDLSDECPELAENINEVEDEDGCPEPEEVKLLKDRIELSDAVHFESGRSIIKKKSYSLLKGVAEILVEHPQLHIQIVGHTDSYGDEEDNLYLSQDRADAVRRFLIDEGVDPKQVTAVGYGESKPIQSNKTARGRSINRRVEFNVVDIPAKD
jgi:outer membrane protein OmpA-like peptidoglycan-associated protein